MLTTNSTLLLNDHQIFYLLSVFSHYKNFSYIIHADEASMDTANYLLEIISSMVQFVAIYNADDEDYENFQRPHGIKFINVVLFGQPWRFESFLVRRRNVILYDNVIFVLHDKGVVKTLFDEALPFWEMRYIKLAGNVIILKMIEPKRIVAWNKCYYCGYKAANLKLLEITGKNATTIEKGELMPGKFNRFNGHKFRVAYLDFFPYMFCKSSEIIDNISICLDYKGSEARLVEEASRQLNFTFEFVKEVNESFSRILENLLSRKVDFAVGGISVTYRRFNLVTFTTNIRYENLVLLYANRESKWKQLIIFLLPFQTAVWMAILFTLLTLLVCINLTLWINKPDFYKNLSISTRICIKSIVEQTDSSVGAKLFRSRWAPFVVLATLLFACIEFNTAYKTKLSSIFIRPPHTEPNSVEELIENDYKIIADNLPLYHELLSATDPFLIYFNRHGLILARSCDQVSYLVRNRAAMIGESARLRYYVPHNCWDNLHPDAPERDYSPDKLRITSVPVRSNPHAWMIQPAVPFWKAFDDLIGKLKNGGFIEKWNKDAIRESRRVMGIPYSTNSYSYSGEHNEYKMAFLIYSIGLCIALTVFILEKIKR